MDLKSKNLASLIKNEKAITAMFINKLHAIYQTNYRKSKKGESTRTKKSKDKGGDKKNTVKKTSKRNVEGLKRELKLMLSFYGIGTPHITPPDQPPLSKEQISMIDIDFDGLYFTPAPDDLSATYRAFKESNQNFEITHFNKPYEYDLNEVPCWADMKKFNSFRVMSRPICSQLAQINYPLDKLNQLTYVDMLDMIASHNKAYPEHHMPNQRTRFLKMFAACYYEEFLEKMSLLGEEKESKDLLTYVYYLDRSEKCPQDLRYIMSLYTVHHGKNRKNANELEDYSKVNDFSNLFLCKDMPHHKILHTPYEIDINRNIVFFGSFLQEFQIIRNPEKERQYLQGNIKEFTPALLKANDKTKKINIISKFNTDKGR